VGEGAESRHELPGADARSEPSSAAPKLPGGNSRLELELELARESAARFRDLVENAPCCIYELDQEGRFLWMNPAGLRMANEPDEARIIGARCLDYVVEEDRPRVAAALHAAQNGQKPGCEFTCKNRRIIRVRYVPISDGKVEIATQELSHARIDADDAQWLV
jgi:PAS domain S-box-containing protein